MKASSLVCQTMNPNRCLVWMMLVLSLSFHVDSAGAPGAGVCRTPPCPCDDEQSLVRGYEREVKDAQDDLKEAQAFDADAKESLKNGASLDRFAVKSAKKKIAFYKDKIKRLKAGDRKLKTIEFPNRTPTDDDVKTRISDYEAKLAAEEQKDPELVSKRDKSSSDVVNFTESAWVARKKNELNEKKAKLSEARKKLAACQKR